MGWLDRKDVLQWIDWVLAQDSEAEIVLHGVSMGAATTMMTAGGGHPGTGKSVCGGLRLHQRVGYFFPVS